MEITPDSVVYWAHGPLALNATILFTWLVMALLTLGSWLITRRLGTGVHVSAWQSVLESIVSGIRRQLLQVSRHEPRGFFAFIATLFLFIAASNLLAVVPGFRPPTGSLSTAAALAACVFVAVPAYGIAQAGIGPYLRNYLNPTPLMLPFNVMGELCRTMALAVRLFGNAMSGNMIAAILLVVAPLVFPVLMQLFGLLTGLVQAYIFAVLAAVYIGAGMEVQQRRNAA